MNSLNCLAVGDSGVGKTCLLVSFATNTFLDHYTPTISDNYTTIYTHNGEQTYLSLRDTGSQDPSQHLRPLLYPTTNVIFLCFSVVSPTSFENLITKWIPEIQHFSSSTTRLILVGTKTDLRHHQPTLSHLLSQQKSPITPEMGFHLAGSIGAESYVECSAISGLGIRGVFDLVVEGRKGGGRRRRVCGEGCVVL